MKYVLTIATNELRMFLRDRMALVWLVAMPLIFMVAFGIPDFHYRRAPSNTTPGVLIENNDAGFLGGVFVTELATHGIWVIAPENRADAKFIVRVPADFTERVLAKEVARVEFSRVEGADGSQGDLVGFRLAQTVFVVNARLVEYAVQAASSAPPTEESLRAILDRENPVTLDARFAGRRPVPVHFNQSLPATLVMYLLMNLMIFGSTRTAAERELGVLRRISIHPVSRLQLVSGKILGLMLLALVPIVVLLLAGQFAFKVNIASNAAWIVLTLLLFSWVAASLGLLIGFVVKAHEKIIAASLLVALPMAALGGCWWPLEIVPEWLQGAAHATPVAWALDALHQFITFGGGIEAAAGALGVLALFGIAANILAAKFFRV
jgi:ABC-type multidrug transport system permease subunit